MKSYLTDYCLLLIHVLPAWVKPKKKFPKNTTINIGILTAEGENDYDSDDYNNDSEYDSDDYVNGDNDNNDVEDI